jgi:hypothetical protein
LLLNDRPGVVPADIKYWDALIVSILPPRILPIPYEEHFVLAIEIWPFNSADFILTHCGCDRETNDTTERDLLQRVPIECCDESIEFIVRWSPVSLITFSHEAQSCKCNASQIYALYRKDDSVDGCGVRQDCPYIPKIDPQRDWARTLSSAFFSKLNQTLAIKFWELKPPKSVLKKDKARGL